MPQGWAVVPEAPAAAPAGWTPVSGETPTYRMETRASESNPSLWAQLNSPLLPQIHEAATAVANWLDHPTQQRSRLRAQIEGLIAGSVEGAGHVVSGFTSPIGIALTLAGVGPESTIVKEIPALKSLFALKPFQTLQRMIQGSAGAAFGVEGTARAIEEPTVGGKALGVAEAAAGAAGALGAVGPVRINTANPNPAERAAVDFGMSRGVPVDAGTATGNRYIRGVQAIADTSPLGGGVANRSRQAQGAALERTGRDIAASVHPSPVTPEQAGAALTTSTQDLIDSLTTQANEHYGRLRTIEADPANARLVPDVRSQAQSRELSKQMAESLGSHAPTPAELQEMRRIRAEMDALPFVKRTFNEGGARQGGDLEVVGGAAGAPVYDDILANSPGNSLMSRKEVIVSIDQALIAGRFTNGAKGALEVARKRIAGDTTLTRPSLPPEAGDLSVAKRPMQLPVGLAKAKEAMQPIYERFRRESQLVPLQGAKARAFTAIDRLMNGPDFESISVVDEALSDIKALARQDQGRAKLIVSALEPQVQAAVRRAGPAAVKALEMGRAAIKTRVSVQDVLDAIQAEPVKAFGQATARHDSAVGALRRLQDVAPDVMPQVGRAWLDDALQTATAEGGFQHAAKLDADWRRLGPETKAILFPGGQAKALDAFFLLAKKLADQPNPSQTATVSNTGAQTVLMFTHPATGVPLVLGSGALSKMLRSPRAVTALTRGLTLFNQAPVTRSASLRLEAYQNLANALRWAGAGSALPAAADQSGEVPRTAGPRR